MSDELISNEQGREISNVGVLDLMSWQPYLKLVFV